MQSRTKGKAGRGERSSEEEEEDDEEEVTAQGEVGGARLTAVSRGHGAVSEALELRSSRGVNPAPSVREPAH